MNPSNHHNHHLQHGTIAALTFFTSQPLQYEHLTHLIGAHPEPQYFFRLQHSLKYTLHELSPATKSK